MTDIDVLDVLVVGGGVVGLAAAAAAARDDRSVAVLDRHRRPGTETSTHNSGVIHAGLYYPANSLKARLCVEGRAQLYEFCERRGVPHARTGKLVVATEPGDEARLAQLEARARANGVDDVRLIGRDDIVARQPGLAATTALLSPSTGLVAADALVQALLQECRDHDVSWIPGTAVTNGMRAGAGSKSEPSRRRYARGSWSTPPGSTQTTFPRRSEARRSRFIPAGGNTQS